MVRGEIDRPDDPEPDAVFGTFDDPACRAIIETVDEPMSAKEVADTAGIPVSTTYKKLDRLQEASLVTRETQLDPGGHHRARFVVNFDRIVIELNDDRKLSVDVESRLAKPEQQIVDMWSTVREQT